MDRRVGLGVAGVALVLGGALFFCAGAGIDVDHLAAARLVAWGLFLLALAFLCGGLGYWTRTP